VPAGRYRFEPAEETQHDTSPHEVQLAGKKHKVQTASAVLCYSHMVFFQCYPTFRRFDCKVFLTEALRYFGGATKRMMIDNTHVVVLRRGALWAGERNDSRARNGSVWRTLRVPLRSA
jgi:transposase